MDGGAPRPAAPERDVWERARAELDGLPGGRGLNIAHEAVDRHATGTSADNVALRLLGRDRRREVTYRELREVSNRFANVLASLDVAPGDAVFLLLGRDLPLFAAVFGTLKHRGVVSPLFPAFGPEPIRQRMTSGHGRVLVTTEALYTRKVLPIRDQLPELRHVLLAGATGPDRSPDGGSDGAPLPDDTTSLDALLAAASTELEIPPTDHDDPALLHFTSGTTGQPKGAIHVHEAVVAHHATAAEALDLQAGDVFWCTADPGWVTGMSYGVIAPLTRGAVNVVDERDFDADRWYRTLQDEQVDVWYTSPTAIRMLMRAGDEVAAPYDLSHLRFIASVGEPLNPEAIVWSEGTIGLPIHDNWWQTETGGIMIANTAAEPVTPGSMGRPLAGIEVAILARDDTADGDVLCQDGAAVHADLGEEGHLALRAGWPSMFRGYLGDDERYRRCFVDGWYVTGDLASIDADGHVWFSGRANDVIKSAGHLIGPFEVERALMAHDAVIEAAVIGIPDPVAGETVKAFVTLREGIEPDDALRRELLGFSRSRLGPAVAPRAIEFDQHLPHTRSGKILRRLLRARELGLPEGDLSTLETSP